MKRRFRAFAVLVLCSILGVAIGQTFDLPLASPFGQSFDFPIETASPPSGLLVSVFDKPSPDSRRDLLTIQKAAIEVAKRATECTVALQLGGAMGSGVVVSEDGLILTAAHVVSDPNQSVQVRFPDGRLAMAKSLGMHTSADAALVQILDDGDWPFLPLATKEQMAKAGDWCVALGHPGGFDDKRSPPVRLGRVIDVRSTVMRTDCTIMGGDSGGPLFDMQGRVIGIHSRIAENVTENFHVPSTAFHEAWDVMMEGNLYPKPIPSKFLAILDKDKDGKLTRKELTSDYQRGVYDRLLKEFELDDEEDLSIKSVVRKKFKWYHGVRAEIVEIENVRDFNNSLTSNQFIRGSMMQDLVLRSLEEVDDQKGMSNVVRVYEDGRRVALGTIVDSDGFVLTKSSRLGDEDKLECRMLDGTRRTAELVARDEEYDFALLKIHAQKLMAPNWNLSELRPGTLTVVPNSAGDIEAVGVVGVPPRKIDEVRAMIGIRISPQSVTLDDGSKAALVASVVAKSGGERAGIEAGDILLSVAGESVTSLNDIVSILKNYRASDEVDTIVRRGDNDLTLNVRLLSANDIFLGMEATWRMAGRLSRRRDGFEKAFQIDAIVEPQFCGGPVVDMSGQIIGVTLARASRVASYAISSADLQPILDRMRSQASSITTTKLEKRLDAEIE